VAVDLEKWKRLVDKACKLSDQHLRKRILYDREADLLASTLHRLGCYPMNRKYPRTPDGIRKWAQDLILENENERGFYDSGESL
jgi:hypothetical protein